MQTIPWTLIPLSYNNHIGGVMVSVGSSQTKDYKIDICCFSVKHPALRRKSKDWLARNQDNVSEWGGMSIRRLLFQLFQWAKLALYKKQQLNKRVGLVQSGSHYHFIANQHVLVMI